MGSHCNSLTAIGSGQGASPVRSFASETSREQGKKWRGLSGGYTFLYYWLLFIFFFIINLCRDCCTVPQFQHHSHDFRPNCKTAKLAGVLSVDKSSRTASVVIDARDKFGNPLRLIKTATFNPLKLRSYVKTCVTNPLACVAVAAIGSAILYYGYTLTTDGKIMINVAGGSYPLCVGKILSYANAGGAVSASGPTPCASASAFNGTVFVFSKTALPSSPRLLSTTTTTGYYYTSDTQTEAKYGTRYKQQFSTAQTIPATSTEISDAQLMDTLLGDPATLQIASGVYPDLFDPVSIPETATATDVGTLPEPDPATDPNSEYEEMVDMPQVPEQTINLNTYFSWGSSWLPKSCPTPQRLIEMNGQSFDFDYSLLCSTIQNYISPFVRFTAILAFLTIVIGGARAND